MTNTSQHFVHVGFGNMLCANRIEAMLTPGTACAKRMLKAAKKEGSHFDLTFGRATKCLLLLEDGKIVGCALTPKTIAARINVIPDALDNNDEGEDEDEDSGTVREAVDPT